MKEVIISTYAPSYDATFVMKEVVDDNGVLLSIECVGWYCGEPNEMLTEINSHGEVKAILG